MTGFSTASNDTYVLTPLAAAIVEALPDQESVRSIKRRFSRYGACPVSKIFTSVHAIRAFYQEHPESDSPAMSQWCGKARREG